MIPIYKIHVSLYGLRIFVPVVVRLDHGALQGLYLTRFIGIHPVGGHECHKVGRPNTFI